MSNECNLCVPFCANWFVIDIGTGWLAELSILKKKTLIFVSGGLFSYFKGLLGSREMRILILGLDGAGKTTILYRLQVGEVVTTIPTIGFNVEQVTYKNLKFQVWDLGGQTSIRPYWRCYYSNTDAIIYVVDSVDRDRIGISKDELLYMLRVSNYYLHTFCLSFVWRHVYECYIYIYMCLGIMSHYRRGMCVLMKHFVALIRFSKFYTLWLARFD